MAVDDTDLYWAFFTDIPHIAARFRRFAPPGAHVREHPRDGWTLTTAALPKSSLTRADAIAFATRVSGGVVPPGTGGLIVTFSRMGGPLEAALAPLSSRCTCGDGGKAS